MSKTKNSMQKAHESESVSTRRRRAPSRVTPLRSPNSICSRRKMLAKENSSWLCGLTRAPSRNPPRVSLILKLTRLDPDPDSSAPDVKYQLEYVYGYRCEDSRANVCYNAEGNVAYMTAAVGVILNKGANTQTFFGGGQVDNTSKKVANDMNHHTNDIMSFGMSSCRKKAVTG